MTSTGETPSIEPSDIAKRTEEILRKENPTPNMESNNEGCSSETSIHHVSVRLPSCWRSNISLWFAQAEAQFTNSRIKEDFTKYNIIVAALDAETLQCVSDIVINPPVKDKYCTLKASLIDRLQDSEEKRLTRLLTGLQLEDRKPTGLLRHMLELAGPALAESAIVKTLWLQRLPQHVQAILSALPDNNLNQLALAADKIVDVYQATECGAVDHDTKPGTSRSERNDTSMQDLLEQVAALTHEVKLLKMSQVHNRDRPSTYSEHRSQSPRRNNSRQNNYRNPASRPRSRSRGRSPNKAPNGYCRLHAKFGENAYRCQQPCTFRSKRSGNDGGIPQ